MPLIAQKRVAEYQVKNTQDPITKAILPVIIVYFTCTRGEDQLLGSVFATCLEYMASKPKGV
jgi:hypothetical protein